jgi:hypothetical protein
MKICVPCRAAWFCALTGNAHGCLALRRICGSQRKKVTVGSRILHSEEPHNLCSLREMMADKGVEGVILFDK